MYGDTIKEAEAEIAELVTTAKTARKVEITLDGKKMKTKKGEHYHEQFENILKYSALDKNVMLVGDSGTGKSHVCQQVAESLNLPYGQVSCSVGMSESALSGLMTANGDYLETRFLNIFENGGVFLIDEYDGADGNVLLNINTALANGVYPLPKRIKKPLAKRHANCIIICAGNTWGNGQGSRKFSGRGAIDGATLDRFTKIEYGYDRILEADLVGKDNQQVAKFLWNLRENVADKNLTRIVSTRAFIKANRHLTNGISFYEFANRLVIDWTNAEKEKCNVNGLIEKYNTK